MQTSIETHLPELLRLAAACQLFIAILSLFLERLLGWKEDVARMSPLVREVFKIHGWFIALTLTIFSLLTWRFAAELAAGSNEFARWFAGCVALFWGLRCIMQWTHYSSSHWKGQEGRTAIHWTLFIGYGCFAVVYLLAARTP